MPDRPPTPDALAPTTPIDGAELARLRADTPSLERHIHLNHCGASPSPRPVVERMVAHLELEAELGGYEASEDRMPAIRGTYDALAELLDTRRECIALVENATVGFAQALSSFDLAPGDAILTSREDYVSNQLMYLSLAKRRGVRVDYACSRPEGGVDLEHLEERLAAGPRLLALTHVPTNSGLVQPVEEAGALARAAGVPYLLDACQSVGQRPVSMEATQADFLTATARKFLRGPRGLGFLAVSQRVLDSERAPLYLDLAGARWSRDDGYELAPTAARFENWEFPFALVLGLGEAVRYARAIGIERIQRRAVALANRLRAGLAEHGLRVLDRGPDPCAIVTVELPGRDPESAVAELRAAGMTCNASLQEYGRFDFGDKGVEWALRLATHCVNTEEEVDRAVELVARLGTAASPRG